MGRPADEPRRRGTIGAGKQKAGERFGVVNAFVDFTLASLPRNAIAVWLVLWRDTRDGTARTSMAELARRAGCSTRTVVRVVKALESAGLVRVVYRGGFRRGPSRYRVRALDRPG
jgi:hypothetical protein